MLNSNPGASLPAPAPASVRPIMRGTMHLVAALLAPFGLVLLLLIADSPRAYVGASIFAATLIALYATSAGYHLVPWPPRLRRIVARVDHSMIFALIAGTYTPFCLLVLGNSWGISMLAVVWSLAGAGILMVVLWPSAPRWLGVALYMGLGWLAIARGPAIVDDLDVGPLALLALGGAFYTVGALVYALRRPNPFPKVFGFHEIFHVFVIAGSAVHFTLIAVYVLPS